MDIQSFIGDPITGFDPIEFTPLVIKATGYTVEYNITRNKQKGAYVQLHIWPMGKEFPDDIVVQLTKAFSTIQAYVTVCEYVPEVCSWYAELAGTPMELTKELVESWLAAKFV